MLPDIPEILRGKIYFHDGPHMDEPCTEEEKAAFDEFVKSYRERKDRMLTWEE